MAGCVKFPLLRVRAVRDGSLLPRRREGALPPVDEGWWRDVLLDPRAQTPLAATRFAPDSPFAHDRLDRQHGGELMIACVCGLGRVVDKAAMIAQVGGDMNVHWLARHLIDCGRRTAISNDCRAHCAR
jgi:hypothetical protein